MNLKKTAALLTAAVFAFSAFPLVNAGAEMTDTDGIITWTFDTPETATDIGTTGSNKPSAYHLYNDKGFDSTTYNSLSEITTDSKSLAFWNQNGNSINSRIGKGEIFITYSDQFNIYYTPSVNGIIVIDAKSTNNQITTNYSTSILKKDEQAAIRAKSIYDASGADRVRITEVSFIPSELTHNLTFTAADKATDEALEPVITLNYKDGNELANNGTFGVYDNLYGDYTYTVSLDGYRPITGEINMTEENKTIDLKMAKKDDGIVKWTFDGITDQGDEANKGKIPAGSTYIYTSDTKVMKAYDASTDELTSKTILLKAGSEAVEFANSSYSNTLYNSNFKNSNVLTMTYRSDYDGIILINGQANDGSHGYRKECAASADVSIDAHQVIASNSNRGRISEITFVPTAYTHTLTLNVADTDIDSQSLSGKPTITLNYKNGNAVTADQEGAYSKLYGTYTYTVSLDGYNTITRDVDMSNGDKTIDITMIPNTKSAVRYVTSDGTVIGTKTGDAVSTIYYPIIVQDKDNNYYKTSATTFGKTFEAAGVADVTYDTPLENCIYYVEAEDVMTVNGSTPITDAKYSGGKAVATAVTVKDGDTITTQGNEFDTGDIQCIKGVEYKVTVGGSHAYNGNRYIIVTPEGETTTNNNTVRGSVAIQKNNVIGTATFTPRYTAKMNITFSSDLNIDYIYIEKEPVDLTGATAYAGAFTSDGQYDFSENPIAEATNKLTEDAATAYTASFTNASGAVYDNPSITWEITYGSTAPEVGARKWIVPVDALDGTETAEQLKYGLVIKGALLDSTDAESMSAVLSNGSN